MLSLTGRFNRLTGLIFFTFFSGMVLLCATDARSASSAKATENSKAISASKFKYDDRSCGVNPSRTLFRNVRQEEVALFFLSRAVEDELPIESYEENLKKKSERKEHIKEFLKKNSGQIKAFNDVVRTVLLKTDEKKLSWIAFQYTEEGSQGPMRLFEFATALEKLLTKDKLKAEEIQSFLLGKLGPVFYSLWRNPALRKSLRPFTLDDGPARKAREEYIDGREAKMKPFIEILHGSGIVTSDLEKFIELCNVDLFSGALEPNEELKQIIAKAKKPAMKKALQEYRAWTEKGVATFLEIDRKIASSVLAQKGHGLLIVDPIHGPGVTDQLMGSCPNHRPKDKNGSPSGEKGSK